MAFNVVVMAAGKGTRMKSARPKVLHTLAGRALLQHVLDAVAAVGDGAGDGAGDVTPAAPAAARRTVVVTGHGAEAVEAACADWGHAPLHFARQMPQLGTGHAVLQALPLLDEHLPTTLVLNGDVPLVQPATLRALAAAAQAEQGQAAALVLLSITLPDPSGYGRIVRDAEGRVRAIVEHKDATPEQRALGEVYTGMMAAPTALLRRWVSALKNDNAQREYYLTDVVALAVAEGVPVRAVAALEEAEVLGVNSPHQLADLERRHQRRVAHALMDAGVRLADPARLDVRGSLACGSDVEIDVGCVFEGRVRLGDGVRVGAHCVLRDADIAAGAVIHPFTHIEGAQVGPGALVGPYARLRPGAVLGAEVHVGNFVEIKNSQLGAGSKANHLAYLGDASVGERVNFGAGSITANYDGAHKHRTVIGDEVHVGSNCVLVAPITLGAGATIGGGSTLSRDAPAGQLTVARARATSLPQWTRPSKAKPPPATG